MRAIFLCLALISAHLTIAQERCGTIAPPPGELENWIQLRLRTRMERPEHHVHQESLITIPVVVHVLHKGEPVGTGTNLSFERIKGQIDSLSADFRRLNADTVNTPSVFKPIAADTEINFTLAKQDPKGKLTNGIVRINTGESFVPSRINDLIEMRSYSHWPADNYLNIYCADLGNGFIGYATFPETDVGGKASRLERFYLDGVYMDFEYFGVNPDAPAFESRGRTLTHEVGHFFGLRHIWGDGNCTRDDFIDDTPLANIDNGGYTSPCTFPNPNDDFVCVEGEPEMFQNYMDYTDDICMNLFTQGQKACMRVVAENSPRRESLITSPALIEVEAFLNDLSISKIISPDFATCNSQITPIIEVTNTGSNEITQYSISLTLNGSDVFTSSKNISLQPFETDILSFPNQMISGNSSTIGFRVTEVNNDQDGNSDNNFISKTLSFTSSINLPFVQTFEDGNEMLGSFDSQSAWNTAIAPELSPSNRALVFQSYDNNSSFGDELKITTPPLDLNGVDAITLSFKYAYSGSPNGIYDRLIVRGSKDCGVSYPDVLFSEINQQDFNTTTPTTSEFVPSNESEWKEVTLIIPDYQDVDGARIQFEGINGSNNIYLDNIRIGQANIFSNDISLESIHGSIVSCDKEINLTLEVKNVGSEPITAFSIEGLANNKPFTQSFQGLSILFQEYETFPIDISAFTLTENTISLSVTSVNGRSDESAISNTLETLISINESQDDFPLTVDFEDQNLWTNTSPQDSSLWKDTIVDGNTVLKASTFDFQTPGKQSWFVSPKLFTGGLDSAGLSFRVSYARRQGFNDQLRVLLSNDCQGEFDQVLMEANSDSLSVAETNVKWIPSTDDDWKTYSLDLSSRVEFSDTVRIAFVMVNGNGNDLYLDDISIRGNELAHYPDLFRVYPNPVSQGVFNLGLNLPSKNVVKVQIADISGRIIMLDEVSNAFNQILSYQTPKGPGLYFVRIIGPNFVQTQRLFVESN